MFMSVCICVSGVLSFLNGKICAIQEPSIIIIVITIKGRVASWTSLDEYNPSEIHQERHRKKKNA